MVLAPAVKLSLVIPVYNEAPTLREIIQRVVAVDFDKELVLVDDGSTDGSRELLGEVRDQGLSRWLRDPAAARGTKVPSADGNAASRTHRRPSAGSMTCSQSRQRRQTTTKCVRPVGSRTTTIAGRASASGSRR